MDDKFIKKILKKRKAKLAKVNHFNYGSGGINENVSAMALTILNFRFNTGLYDIDKIKSSLSETLEHIAVLANYLELSFDDLVLYVAKNPNEYPIRRSTLGTAMALNFEFHFYCLSYMSGLLAGNLSRPTKMVDVAECQKYLALAYHATKSCAESCNTSLTQILQEQEDKKKT